jgi:hypothetical protein
VGCTHSPLTCHPITITPPEPEDSAATLGELKKQLKAQLASVEEQEKALEASMQPQTTSQIDKLVEKLQAALEDLKAQRVTLAAKEAEEKKKEKKG